MSVLSSLSHFCSGWDSSPWDGDTHNQGVSFHLILTGLRKSLTAVPSDLEFCQVSHHTGEPRVYRRVLQNGRGWGVRNAKGKGDYRGRSVEGGQFRSLPEVVGGKGQQPRSAGSP